MTNREAKLGAIPEPTEEAVAPDSPRSDGQGGRNGQRKTLLLLGAAAGLLLVVWWLAPRPHRESLARAVPVSAIGYLEMESGASLLQSLTALEAWPSLSAAEVEREWRSVTGSRRWLLSWLPRLPAWMRGEPREWVDLLDSRVALILTALEWKGEMVRPHWTLLLEAPNRRMGRFSLSASEEVRHGWVTSLAERALGALDDRKTFHAGVEIVGYHSRSRPELALYVARLDDFWMLSNQWSGLQSCLDAHLGRAPKLRDDFYWQQARARIAPQGEPPPYLFGYVSANGVTRLLQSGIHLLTAPLEAELEPGVATAGSEPTWMMRRGLVGLLDEAVASLAPRLFQGVAFAERERGGGAGTRTLVQLKQDLVEQLASSLRSSEPPRQQLAQVPAAVVDWTIFEVADPLATLGAVEAAISARIGIAESFLLHQSLQEGREILLAPRPGSPSATPIRDGVVAMRLAASPAERVWVFSNVDLGENAGENAGGDAGGLSHRLLLPEVAGRPATLLWRDLRWRGSAPALRALPIRSTSTEGTDSVIKTSRWQRTPTLVDPLPGSPFLIRHYFGEEVERDRLQAILRLPRKAEGGGPSPRQTVELPWAVRGAALVPEGLLLEAQTSFGSFPLLWEVWTSLGDTLSLRDQSAATLFISDEEECQRSLRDELRDDLKTG
jgi:hypothetical protein